MSQKCHNRNDAPRQTASLFEDLIGACENISGGISRPSVFAVLRLMAKRNLVACWYGISPGLVPRKI